MFKWAHLPIIATLIMEWNFSRIWIWFSAYVQFFPHQIGHWHFIPWPNMQLNFEVSPSAHYSNPNKYKHFQQITLTGNSEDFLNPTFSLHCMCTPGTLQFKLGHYKGRWALFNVKLHFLPLNDALCDRFGQNLASVFFARISLNN